MIETKTNAYATFEHRIGVISTMAALEAHDGQPALEGVGIIGKTVDLFSRFLFNFKTEVFGLLSKFKRSELRAYHESNPMKVRDVFLRVEKMNLSEFMVPVPDGMHGTYAQAVSLLTKLLAESQIEHTVSVLRNALDIFTRVNYTHPDAEDVADLQQYTTELQCLSREDVQKRLGTVFTENRFTEARANSAFGNPREVMSVDAILLKSEKVFKAAMRTAGNAGQLEGKYSAIIDRVSRGKNMDVNFLRLFEAFLRQAALQLDLYGVIVHELLRVEHNFTLALQRIYERP